MQTMTLEYWMDDEWFVGRLREIPGVFSQGKTLAELEENIREAYRLVMEDQAPVPMSGVRQKPIELAA